MQSSAAPQTPVLTSLYLTQAREQLLQEEKEQEQMSTLAEVEAKGLYLLTLLPLSSR